MLKKLIALGILCGSLAPAVVNASEVTTPPAWQIDPVMKFSYGYLPTEKDKAYHSCQTAFNYMPADQPDINNINLAAFAKLGFQIPTPNDANNYRFYLKLYKFPAKLDAKKSSALMLQQFYLNKLPEAKYLKEFMALPANGYVKYGYIAPASRTFSKSDPLPQFCLPHDIQTAQKIFDSQLPFDTLYIASRNSATPGLAVESQVALSRSGLFALHNQLIAYYQDHLKQLDSSDTNSFYFKLPDSTSKELKVISIPKNPLIFNNWRDLPFPQDPQHIFATGLVLVKQVNYQINPNEQLADKQALLATASQTTILELGSVVNLTAQKH